MNHKPNRFNDILTNIVTGVTITAWGTAVILLLIKLAIWVFPITRKTTPGMRQWTRA